MKPPAFRLLTSLTADLPRPAGPLVRGAVPNDIRRLQEKPSTKFCRYLRRNAQVFKQCKHTLAHSLVVLVDRTGVFWFRLILGLPTPARMGRRIFSREYHQCCDGADSLWRNRVSAGIVHFWQEVLARSFFRS